jgi:prepilin-type N-terminal cleavage/methylation domain-containing protein
MESPRAHGFTLIEIIVSVSLLLVLSGLFMASYSGFNNSQTVKQAASTLVLNLQAVRTNAAAGAKPALCDTLTGYIVKFPDSGSYTARALCQSGEVGATESYSLPTGVLFSPTPASFTFYALNRGASAAQTMYLTGFGTTAAVFVDASGIVSDLGATPAP